VFPSTNARLRPKFFITGKFLTRRHVPASKTPSIHDSPRRQPPPFIAVSLLGPCPRQLPRFLFVLPERTTSRTGKPAGGRNLAHGNPAAGRACQHGRGRQRCSQSGTAGQRELRRFDEVSCIYPAFSVLPLPPAWVLSLPSLSSWRDVTAAGCRPRARRCGTLRCCPVAEEPQRSPDARLDVTAAGRSWRSRDVRAERQEGGDRRRCAVQHPHTTRQLLEKLRASFVLILVSSFDFHPQVPASKFLFSPHLIQSQHHKLNLSMNGSRFRTKVCYC